MAILSGRLYDGDDDNNEEDETDIEDQPTRPIPLPPAALAIARAQELMVSSSMPLRGQLIDIHVEIPDYPYILAPPVQVRQPAMCPICCMDREEKMREYVDTTSELLLICDYHIEQINHVQDDETLELLASILHVAYLRYSWPPGYLPGEPG